MRFSHKDAFIKSLPKSEMAFVRKVKPKISSGPLKKRLLAITKIFGEKRYGFEEALTDGVGIRYPSEVREQRFCAEEALKNYILVRSLGLESEFLATPNFRDRGMAHDVVLVHDKGKTLMLDWGKVIEVNKKGDHLFGLDGELIAETPITLTPKQVGERTKLFRRGENLIKMIQSPQLLYNSDLPDGGAEVYVEYEPDKNKISLTHAITNFGWDNPYGYSRYTLISEGKPSLYEEWRLVKGRRGIFCDEVSSLFNCKGYRAPLDILKHLSVREADTLTLDMLYSFVKNAEGQDCINNQRKRRKLIRILEKLSRNKDRDIMQTASAQLSFYETVRKRVSQLAAEVYLDSLVFKSELEMEYKNPRIAFEKVTGLNWRARIEEVYRETQQTHFKNTGLLSRSEEVEEKIISLLKI